LEIGLPGALRACLEGSIGQRRR